MLDKIGVPWLGIGISLDKREAARKEVPVVRPISLGAGADVDLDVDPEAVRNDDPPLDGASPAMMFCSVSMALRSTPWNRSYTSSSRPSIAFAELSGSPRKAHSVAPVLS